MAEATPDVQLEGGTYEILRRRLQEHAGGLRSRLESLNAERRRTFGAIEARLLATERLHTAHNCIARDIVAIGDHLLFGYNVQFGLKATTDLSDVFSVCRFTGEGLEETTLDFISDPEFLSTFQNLYKYYKHTVFSRFFVSGPFLFMVFRIGKGVTDIKTFKWQITPENTLRYVDNRSDHEYRYPPQHEFEWRRVTRDSFRDGRYPHISILDRVFVDTTRGDLTIKIEDNTATGRGLYSEPVDDPEQRLDDAEVCFACLGPLILLKIRPYRENNFRYIIFNEKTREARRQDEIGEACITLPDEAGLLFPNGYYLVTGEGKTFDYPVDSVLFERRIHAPNGEDTLFVFHERLEGIFMLLSYNVIEQAVRTPIRCNGYALFPKGELLYFRAEIEPQRHHTVQVWSTPFLSANVPPPVRGDSLLEKIGNRDLVRCLAECRRIVQLTGKDDAYEGLFEDIVRQSSSILDAYFWIAKEEAGNLAAPLVEVREVAHKAIDEFEKVRRIRAATSARVQEVEAAARTLLDGMKPDLFERADEFIAALAKLRTLRGEVIGLRELRYVKPETVTALEEQIVARTDDLSARCVEFLLREDALTPYHQRVTALESGIEALTRAVDAKTITESINTVAAEMETTIEVVGNLRIEDPTQSTRIINGCSEVFTRLNATRARLQQRLRQLQGTEAVAEFSAQMKLLDQSVASYLDLANSPERCDELLNRLLVRIEELEGRFGDFDEYVVALADKRTEVSAALETRRVALIEERNRKAGSLHSAADRILNAVRSRADGMKTIEEISSYFASDLMIEKVRSIAKQLLEVGEPTRADEIETRLKTTRENAVRQLKDRQELFVDGENVIRLGRHAFNVSTQKPDLAIIPHQGAMCFHITGTNYFERVSDAAFLATESVWDREVISESRDVYRGEYLAWLLFQSAGTGDLPGHAALLAMQEEPLLDAVRRFMGPRYDEGYAKGVHDQDAVMILRELLRISDSARQLRFAADARALALAFWHCGAEDEERSRIFALLAGAGQIRRAFADADQFEDAQADLARRLREFADGSGLYSAALAEEAASYLFDELGGGEDFVISPEAAAFHGEFFRVLRESHVLAEFEAAMRALTFDRAARLRLLRGWLRSVRLAMADPPSIPHLEETAALILTDTFARRRILHASVRVQLDGLRGDHPRIADGKYALDFPEFTARLRHFEREDVARFRDYQKLRKEFCEREARELRIAEFQPRVLTSFVRNRLIDEVYLPLIGDNLAKQIGTAGATKRTDLMGMLLLISPPGYGKTTLMEYIASRLGLVMVKINGPVLGHQVTSVDPAEAPNAAAREEIEKLNLAFEMGDNVMIYVDDIQHCSPEFLQKFISLCDGTRRIEGVWKGRSRTYDFRGRKVCIVMAGNPYTESGTKFQIPDMLANRSDTYNLGDIIGDSAEAFEQSYIENALTSNRVLNPLNTRSRKDIHALIRIARGDADNADFESTITPDEVTEYATVLRKLIAIQQVVLKVNLEYIRSAAQADEFRTEPPFKLQGSYRNMNKLAEKVVPVMNDQELRTLLESHYEGESQTLATGTEANMLKLRQLLGWMTDAQMARWGEICDLFRRGQKIRGMKEGDAMAQAVVQLGDLSEGVSAIGRGLAPLADRLAETGREIAREMQRSTAPESAPTITVNNPPAEITVHTPAPNIIMPGHLSADLGEGTLDRLRDVFAAMEIRVVSPEFHDSMVRTDPTEKEARGEFRAPGSMRNVFEENGFTVEEPAPRTFRIQRDGLRPIDLRVRNDRLELRVEFCMDLPQQDPAFAARLLELNAAIQPVSFGLETSDAGRHLVLIESRDGKDLTRSELVEVIRAMESAARTVEQSLGERLF